MPRPIESEQYHLKNENNITSSLPNPQYSKLICKTFTLNAGYKRDNCCGLIDGTIAIVFGFYYSKNSIVAIIKRFLSRCEFFETPCKSSVLDVYFVRKLCKDFLTVNVKEISRKCVRIPHENGFVVFPLLHTVS